MTCHSRQQPALRLRRIEGERHQSLTGSAPGRMVRRASRSGRRGSSRVHRHEAHRYLVGLSGQAGFSASS